MAQRTQQPPSASDFDTDLEDEEVQRTRTLLHRLVTHDRTGLQNAQAFQQMSENPRGRDLFGPDSAFLDGFANCLYRHAENMREDQELQNYVERLRNDFSRETLWSVCQRLFGSVRDVWTGILTLFSFGLELCRQMLVDIYDFILNTISSIIMRLAGDWLRQQGGWLTLITNAATVLGGLWAVQNS